MGVTRAQVPKNGYVPDEATAVRIAEAVFIPIYGEKQVKSEGPFYARAEGDHWVVTGTLPSSRKPNELLFGGSMTVEINRETGCILDVSTQNDDRIRKYIGGHSQ